MRQPNARYQSTQDLSPVQLEHHEVARALPSWFAPGTFRDRYRATYPDRASGSILPSDYCFNRENKGNTTHPRFLLWDEFKKYRFVGLRPGDEAAPVRGRSCKKDHSPPAATREQRERSAAEEQPLRQGGYAGDAQVRDALLAYGDTLSAGSLFEALVPEASDFVVSNPFAFALATCLDRGSKAELIWTIPYWVREALGHLDPYRLATTTHDALREVYKGLPRRPRYWTAAPRTTVELASMVVEEFGGDASRIWTARRAPDVRRSLRSVHGVGPGIASMGVLLIEKAYDIRFEDLDRPHMDIKPDVHTVRVLHRLGAAGGVTVDEAVDAARRLNPTFPGEIDAPLWEIGRRWCDSRSPNCQSCAVEPVCLRVGV